MGASGAQHMESVFLERMGHGEGSEIDGGGMSFIVVARNPNGGGVVFMDDGDDEITVVAEFDSESEAEQAAIDHMLFSAWGWQILEVA